MTVVTTILGLKLGNVVQPSPYRPADMDWIGANTTLGLERIESPSLVFY
ncbi:hypothetical protein ACFP1C_08000 [Levilactobacillus fujinensis]|uniref:Uncharacterized protein n=1 Tax=Levilactobacillus fujinensis TaxID=2486024 RepID=A0ABW1TGC7_9LACO